MELYSPLTDAVRTLRDADAQSQARLQAARQRVTDARARVSSALARSDQVLADLTRWCDDRGRSWTVALAVQVRSRQARVSERIRSLRAEFSAVHTPDEWEAVVARSVGALEATADKGSQECEQLRAISLAVRDLEAHLTAANDGFAQIEAWSAGPGAAIHATALTRTLRAHVSGAQEELRQALARLTAAGTTALWSSVHVAVSSLAARHGQLGVLAGELHRHDAAITEWNRELAALRAEIDGVRVWCGHAQAWEPAQGTAATVEQHVIAVRDDLVRRTGRIAAATSEAEFAAALNSPMSQLTGARDHVEAIRRAREQLLADLARTESAMRSELVRAQTNVAAGEAATALWIRRILVGSIVLTLGWWAFVDGAAAVLLSLLSLGLGFYTLVLVNRGQDAKAAVATRTEQRLMEFVSSAKLLR